MKVMTEKSNKTSSKTAAIDEPIELSAINTALPENLTEPSAEPMFEPSDGAVPVINPRAIFKERIRGYLLSRKSPINLSIAEIASRLRLTDVETNEALIALADEGEINISLVRIVVTVKEA